jgi:hypothetical protein
VRVLVELTAPATLLLYFSSHSFGSYFFRE